MVYYVFMDLDKTVFYGSQSRGEKNQSGHRSGAATLLFRADFSHNRDVFHEFQHILGILHRFGRK